MTSGGATFLVMASEQNFGNSEILDSAATMKRLHISRRTLDRYVHDGKLAALRLPSGHRRYLASDVDALLSSPVVSTGPEPVEPAGASSVGGAK